MLKIDNESVELEGTVLDLLADLTLLMKRIREATNNEVTDDDLMKAVKLSKIDSFTDLFIKVLKRFADEEQENK